MLNKKAITAIILAAGNSTRFKKRNNKVFELINDKPVLSYSLKAFDTNKYVDNIIVVIKENEFKNVNKIINEQKINKKVKLVLGGATRKQSVYNAIQSTNSDIVIIHDAARPLIKQEHICNCIKSMKYYKGVTIAVKSKDTIKITNDDNIVKSTTNRNNTWIIQTPQCFDRQTLLELHKKYINDDFTDDCSILEKENIKVKVIEGNYNNIKITTQDDLIIIKYFLNNKTKR